MALKVKAVEKKIKFSKTDEGVYRYVMQPELYIPLTTEKVIKEAALRSGVSKGVMQACWDAAGEVIKAWATEGHSVALPGLGSMRFGLRAKAVDDVNKVKTSLIKTRRIIFVPAVDLKDELANTAIQITCYDRNGNEVKRVTSADAGEVEDPEGDGTTDSENNGSQNGSGSQDSGSQSGSGSGQGGSGSQQEQNGLEKPTILGVTPFTQTTEVTMSGPEDAEIHYTTDGSTPTAESTLYEGGFTLSDTTTIKAVAIKDGESSEITTKSFEKSSGGPGGFETGS